MNELFRMNDYGDIWQEPDLFDTHPVERCERCGGRMLEGDVLTWPYCGECPVPDVHDARPDVRQAFRDYDGTAHAPCRECGGETVQSPDGWHHV